MGCVGGEQGEFLFSFYWQIHTESMTFMSYKLNYCVLCILAIPCFQDISQFFELFFTLYSPFCLDIGPRSGNIGRQVLLQS